MVVSSHPLRKSRAVVRLLGPVPRLSDCSPLSRSFVSLPALEAFAAKVGSDPQLKAKLDAAAGLDEVVSIAEAHGHVFNKATLLRVHAKAVAEAPDHVLEAVNSWGDALMHCFGATDRD